MKRILSIVLAAMLTECGGGGGGNVRVQDPYGD